MKPLIADHVVVSLHWRARDDHRVAVPLEGQVVLRNNVSSDALRSFGEDLINLLVHWPNLAMISPAFHSLSTIPIHLQTQRTAVRGERTITLTRLQFVTGLGTRTSS